MVISVKNEVVVMKLGKSDEPTNWSRRLKLGFSGFPISSFPLTQLILYTS